MRTIGESQKESIEMNCYFMTVALTCVVATCLLGGTEAVTAMPPGLSCPAPTRYARQHLAERWRVLSLYNGISSVKGSIYEQTPGGLVRVGEIMGEFRQYYNQAAGTVEADYLFDIGGEMVPVMHMTETLLDPVTGESCLSFFPNGVVEEYVHQYHYDDNIMFSTYHCTNVSSLHYGRVLRSEYFVKPPGYAVGTTSSNCLSVYDPVTATLTEKTCFDYVKVADEECLLRLMAAEATERRRGNIDTVQRNYWEDALHRDVRRGPMGAAIPLSAVR
jgi:hypothetical protein